jgi:hypothetical protein
MNNDAIKIQTENSNVRISKIDLTSFSGVHDTWLYFFDTRDNTVHKNSSIATIDEFHYLDICVKGEAATIIQSLETSVDNYEIAWSLLIKCYENKRVIINKHLQAIFEQPVFIKESDANVRQILDSIKNFYTVALLSYKYKRIKIALKRIASQSNLLQNFLYKSYSSL